MCLVFALWSVKDEEKFIKALRDYVGKFLQVFLIVFSYLSILSFSMKN